MKKYKISEYYRFGASIENIYEIFFAVDKDRFLINLQFWSTYEENKIHKEILKYKNNRIN